MMNVYKSFQSYLGAPAERFGIGSILSEVDVEAKQSTSSSQSLRRTLSADMSSQGWMCQENSLRKSCSFYELPRKSCCESEEISDSESEDRSEEEDGDIFSMTEEEEKEGDVVEKNCGDLWSLLQSEKQQQQKKDSDSSFFALIAPVNKELKADSSLWEPCKQYVHPAKRKSTLSDQSLRLCTESLGCESGTDCSYPSLSDTEDCSSVSSEDNSSVFGEEVEEEEEESKFAGNLKISDNVSGSEQEREIKSKRSFPPPLSSIARSDGPCIHMRSYKQDGRLLLKAVQVESSQKYLRARREDGRLQLHFISTQQQELPPEEEKNPPEPDESKAQNSKAEEKQLQQQQQFKSSAAFSNLSNLRRHVLRSEYQNPSRNKEFPLNLDMNSTAKVKLSLLLKTPQVQGSNLTCSKELNSFSKVPSAAGFEDFVQERPSQSLMTSPALLHYQPLKLYSPAGDFESKSLPKFPCNESFRRCQVRQWLTKLGEPRCIAIS